MGRQSVPSGLTPRGSGPRSLALAAILALSSSVRTELHGGPVEGVVVGAVADRVVGDPVVPARGQLAEERAVLDEELSLVDGLADRWGWSTEGVGKRIWCELDRCGAASDAARASCGGGAVTYDGLAYEAV